MSDEDLKPAGSEAAANDVPAAKKKPATRAKKAAGKKPKPGKSPKLSFNGRVVAVGVSSAGDGGLGLQFSLRPKKGGTKDFTVDASLRNALAEVAALLTAALASRAKLHVDVAAEAPEAHRATAIAIKAK